MTSKYSAGELQRMIDELDALALAINALKRNYTRLLMWHPTVKSAFDHLVSEIPKRKQKLEIMRATAVREGNL